MVTCTLLSRGHLDTQLLACLQHTGGLQPLSEMRAPAPSTFLVPPCRTRAEWILFASKVYKGTLVTQAPSLPSLSGWHLNESAVPLDIDATFAHPASLARTLTIVCYLITSKPSALLTICSANAPQITSPRCAPKSRTSTVAGIESSKRCHA